jgi:putative toxin-antitoxin system antitoxin component (TIGR02293 family)
MSHMAKQRPRAAAHVPTKARLRLVHGKTAGHPLALLGLPPTGTPELLALVARGLPFSAIDRFKQASGLPWDAVCELVRIPPRTLARRRAARRLDAAESDRLVRAARIVQQALGLFEGDAQAARAWLAAPQRAFGGATPLAFARTETGAREVENLIGRLEHGVYG